MQHTKATLGFDTNSTLGHALVFSAAVVAGTFFEAQGTRLEVGWDKQSDAAHQVHANWYSYLAKTFEKEPVGYRYLSRLATTLYFELAMIWAAPAFFIGGAILASLRFPDGLAVFAIVGLVAAVGAGMYFHRQAKCTHDVICTTRKELVARFPS